MATPDHPFYVPGLQIPRFLFRGFNPYSGGGFPGQNTTKEIVPLAFLRGYDKQKIIDKKMNPEMVKTRVRIHCTQSTKHPTPFSSWSHDWRTALGFARHRSSATRREWERLEEDDGMYIAVLDTWALGYENTRRNRIFHVRQFGIPSLDIPCEWLIWGPVSGPGYRCVSLSTIRDTIKCQEWPGHISKKSTRPYLTHTEVRDSLLVAGCFQRKDDASADVMLAVAAAELGLRFWGNPRYISPSGDPKKDNTEPLWPADVLEELLNIFALCKLVLSGRPLVHGNTALEGFPRVSLMNALLSKLSDAEARWKDNNSGTRWASVDWKNILEESLKWREKPCEICVKEGRL